MTSTDLGITWVILQNAFVELFMIALPLKTAMTSTSIKLFVVFASEVVHEAALLYNSTVAL